MADPGAAVEVHGAVSVRGDTTKQNPDALVAQIEHTRDDLARTIDTLAERVSPRYNMRMVREKVTEQVARPEVQIAAVALGVAVVGLTILKVWAKHRRGR